MSPVADIERIRNELLHHGDKPFTSGHLRWLTEGANVTPKAFKRLMEVQYKDYFQTDRGDGSGRLRASGFSSVGYSYLEDCPRRHVLSYLGIPSDPPDSGSMEIMNVGTQLHYYYQLAGLSAGWLADIEVPVEHTPWKLRGSMDGLMADGSGLEIKTTGSPIFGKIEQKRKDLEAAGKDPNAATNLAHRWQIHMYMQATGIEKFSLVYIDRGWPGKFMEFRITQDPVIARAVDDTLSGLVDMIEAEDLPPMLESCQKQTGKTYDGCPYRSHCPSVRGFQ